uniref:Uncharacterized protein n=1 Tax=Fagus sylvatica TaxID=28930 RepID=A0A2N9HYB0_FAGSY
MYLPQAKAIITYIWVPFNPRGAERLPPGIVEAESDFYLQRLWGKPNEIVSRSIEPQKDHHHWSLHAPPHVGQSFDKKAPCATVPTVSETHSSGHRIEQWTPPSGSSSPDLKNGLIGAATRRWKLQRSSHAPTRAQRVLAHAEHAPARSKHMPGTCLARHVSRPDPDSNWTEPDLNWT